MSTKCPTCKSIGFEPSILGPDRCTFCDGTEGGNPPQDPTRLSETTLLHFVSLLPDEARFMYMKMLETVEKAVELRREGVLTGAQYQAWARLIGNLISQTVEKV